jgi:hypothetical protein
LSAETEPIDFLEPSNLGSRSLDGSDAVEKETDSSLGNGWFPKEFILPTKPLSFALGNLLTSPGIDPESGLTRDIYISVKKTKKDVWRGQDHKKEMPWGDNSKFEWDFPTKLTREPKM